MTVPFTMYPPPDGKARMNNRVRRAPGPGAPAPRGVSLFGATRHARLFAVAHAGSFAHELARDIRGELVSLSGPAAARGCATSRT